MNREVPGSRFQIPDSHPRGATLLLALLILGSLTATSLVIGLAATEGLRSVKAIDDAVLASYAAESGVEALLYDVRRRGVRSGFATEGALGNRSRWTRSVTTSVPEVFVTVAKDDSVQLDVIEPGESLTAVDVRALLLTPTAPAAGAWLEVTWSPWLDTGRWGAVVARKLFGPSELTAGREVLVDLRSAPIDGNPVAYRVRLRAVTADVGAVRIRASRDTDGRDLVAIPSRLRATVTGSAGTARQAYRVELPLRSPLLPVFDYVLLSECDIVKGDEVQCP